MRTWTQLELPWELHRAGVKVAVIAEGVGKHRGARDGHPGRWSGCGHQCLRVRIA